MWKDFKWCIGAKCYGTGQLEGLCIQISVKYPTDGEQPLGAGDSAANKLREGPFSNRIYRLMAIGDKGGSGLGLESHSPKLTYPTCGTHQMGAQKLFISVLLSGDLP